MLFFVLDKPSAPQDLRVVDVWKDYMNLSWTAPDNDGGSPLTGYTIEQRDAYEVAYKFVASVDAEQSTYQVNTHCDIKGSISHFIKWHIHPFISKETISRT